MKKGLMFGVQNKIIHKAVLNNKRTVVFPTIQSVKKIGIVGEEVNLNVEDLNSGQLARHSKFFFLINKKEKRTKGFDDENIYSSDLNFWGLPVKSKINNFINEPFDLLINLSDDNNVILKYVCAASVSRLKIGLNTNDKIYDVILAGKDIGLEELFNEIEKILNNFNKNT